MFARLLPLSPFATLTTTPGWGLVRAGNYGGALGDPARWPGPSQIYRASGLSPAQYESAGKRRDGTISREGSVVLRRALIDLGIGLWLADKPSRAYAASMKERGKQGGIIGCAMGPPGQQNRLRHGPGPRSLRPLPLGVTPLHGGLLRRGYRPILSVGSASGQRGAPAAQRGRTTLTVKSR